MKLISISDTEAVQLNIWRFRKRSHFFDTYFSRYDARRVKRARRAAVRRFVRNTSTAWNQLPKVRFA